MPPPSSSYARIAGDPSFSKLSPTERINAILAISSSDDTRFYSQILHNNVALQSYEQTSPKSGTATFKFNVTRFYCNASGNLHGGAQSLIYDVLTSLAMQAIGSEGFWLNGGVSRTLNVSYLRPAPEGIDVLCEVEVTHAGRTLSLLRGVMKRADDGALISTCEHHKAAVVNKPGWESAKL